jgi:hypothetical protein
MSLFRRKPKPTPETREQRRVRLEYELTHGDSARSYSAHLALKDMREQDKRATNPTIHQQEDEMRAVQNALADAQKALAEVEAKRFYQFNQSIRIMAQMDDLAEAMALSTEAYREHYPFELTIDMEAALAAWRAFRPTKGLVAGGQS